MVKWGNGLFWEFFGVTLISRGKPKKKSSKKNTSFNQASTKVQSKLLLHSVAQKLWPLQPFNDRCVWGKYLQKMREINSQIFIPNMPVIKWL